MNRQFPRNHGLLLPRSFAAIQQYDGMMRQATLPGHEALKTLKSEGKILAGGFLLERAIAFIVVESDSPKELDPKELDELMQFIPFWR
jgi:hypothetical protein